MDTIADRRRVGYRWWRGHVATYRFKEKGIEGYRVMCQSAPLKVRGKSTLTIQTEPGNNVVARDDKPLTIMLLTVPWKREGCR